MGVEDLCSVAISICERACTHGMIHMLQAATRQVLDPCASIGCPCKATTAVPMYMPLLSGSLLSAKTLFFPLGFSFYAM